MEMNFCRRCGSPLTLVERHVFQCANSHIIFANSSPTVGIWLVNSRNEVLIATRGIEPHKGALDSIGGFVDEKESFEQALRRELQEELGTTMPIEFHYLTSGYDTYIYRNEPIPLLNLFFWARVPDDFPITVSDDVASAEFIPIDAIPLEKVGHDSIRNSLVLLRQTLTDSKSSSR